MIADHDSGLWRFEDLSAARGIPPELAGFEDVVVGVDPPASFGPDADACGIIAAGRCGPKAWVLEDATVQGLSPRGWAQAATDCARRWGAHVIAESNQGGEMVREMLRLADPEIRVELRHARFSKRARAEPVAALYERGCVRHAPGLNALEDAMLEFGQGSDSPDRVDALVWAVGDLLLRRRGDPRVRRL